jgi:hypothetical protein
MDKRNKDLDELFKEKLTSERSAHPFIKKKWDALELMLDLSEKKRKQKVFVYRTLIGAAATLLISFSIWLIKPTEPISLPQELLNLEYKQDESPDFPQEFSDEINELEEAHAVESIMNDSQHIEYKVVIDEVKFEVRKTLNENLMFYKKSHEIKSSFNSNNFYTRTLPFLKSIQLNSNLKFTDIESDHVVNSLPKRGNDFLISILAAPSLNGVNGFKNGEIGNDLGLLFSFNITNKLSISTGAVYAKKLYEADFDRNIYPNIRRYESINGGFNNGSSNSLIENSYTEVFPESVYADCRVLDIPLNINYSLMDQGNNKVSVGTGISSYFMLKEKYQFKYAEKNIINSEKLELRNENRHIMSVLNFQASYTRQLNPKMGVSLQPYLKIPLEDIGYGETKLQSAGIAVKVNFSLSANK